MTTGILERRLVQSTFVALGLTVAACASAPATAGPSLGDELSAPRGAAYTQVTVDNRNGQDVRVYLDRGVTPISLGSVGSLEQRTFKIPPSVVGSSGFLRLRVVTLASRQMFATDVIPLRLGDDVEWQIESNLALSTVLIR